MTNCTTAKCTSLFARYRVPLSIRSVFWPKSGAWCPTGTIYVCFSNRPAIGWTPPCSCLTQPKACMGLRESHATHNFRH
jgi:hypothetical protein